MFRKYDHTAYLSDVYCRRNDPAQIVCIVSKSHARLVQGYMIRETRGSRGFHAS